MRVLVALAVAGALLLTACGQKDSGVTVTSPSVSATPSASPSAASPSVSPTPKPVGAAKTKEGAIQRFEAFLHGVGREDINVVCEIAGPAAKKAQDQGFGPCTSTFLVTFQLFSPAQKKALQTATVDPNLVVVRGPGTVDVPAEAVRSSVTFTESDLGNSTLEYRGSNWYIID